MKPLLANQEDPSPEVNGSRNRNDLMDMWFHETGYD